MLKVLSPDNGQDVALVVKGHVFVRVTDYGHKSILMEIIIAPAQHHWMWVYLNPNKPIDIMNIGDRFSSFDYTINRAVNDPYCTIYEADNIEDIIKNWNYIVHIDRIKTVYQAE